MQIHGRKKGREGNSLVAALFRGLLETVCFIRCKGERIVWAWPSGRGVC